MVLVSQKTVPLFIRQSFNIIGITYRGTRFFQTFDTFGFLIQLVRQ